MTMFDFDPNAEVDPQTAARVLGDLLSVLGTEAPADLTEMTSSATPETETTGTTPGKPIEGSAPITGKFGEDRGDHTHAGVDMAVGAGTPILAATGGVAQVKSDPKGYGTYVEIVGPNGISTLYGHLSSASIHSGQTVTPGMVIGASGSTGRSTGPHLHFEVHQNGKSVDPMPFLAGGAQVLGEGAVPQGAGAPSEAPQADPEAQAGQTLENTASILTGESPAPADSLTAPETQTSGTGNFPADILRGIGAPVTPENIRAISAWIRAEGTQAAYNPLATTQGAAGASNFNKVGVKNYGDYATGLDATIKTLLNGRYANIIAALKRGNDANLVADAIEKSPWGTGGLVKKVLANG